MNRFKRVFPVRTQNNNIWKSNRRMNWINQNTQIRIITHFECILCISFGINRIPMVIILCTTNLDDLVWTDFFNWPPNTWSLTMAILHLWCKGNCGYSHTLINLNYAYVCIHFTKFKLSLTFFHASCICMRMHTS